MADAAELPPVFVPIDELRATRRQDGKIAMWAVAGGVATHETVVDVRVATRFLNEVALALADVAETVGSRRA